MAQLMEYAEYLSKEIGPRPAGTEEEQQAALYITERFQADSGFSSQIEEFTSTSNVDILKAVPGLIIIVAAILGMIFPMLAIPAFILAAAAAILYTLEAFGNPIVTRALARGASQNVVAKYQPNLEAGRARSRKIVLVAHYDSGKVTPSLVRTVESTKLPISIGLLCVCGMAAAAFFMLLHVFVNTGVGAIVVNVLTVIALIICLYPVLRTLLYRAAPYNEGANNNATGTAALIEVARRISRGSVSEADLSDSPDSLGVSIHGEQAARESGLVPEGAQIRYEAEQLVPPSEIGEYDAEESLLAAKAAIAAMTGQPVERRTYGTVANNLVNSRAHGEDPAFELASETPVSEAAVVEPSFKAAPIAVQPEVEAAPVATPERFEVAQPAVAEQTEADGFKNAPSWFVSAQQNAKKPEGETGPVQRSRYAEAIEAAEREAAERERERAEAERLAREAELRAREKAAREAIEQSTQIAKPVQPVAEVVEAAEAAKVVEVAEVAEAVEKEPPAQHLAEGVPADDEFAASLGNTVAFDPHMLQAKADEQDAVSEEVGKPNPRPVIPEVEIATPMPEPTASVPEPDASASPVPETTSPSRSGLIRKLRTDVPSMSGVIRMQQAGQDVSQPPVRQSYVAPAPAPRSVDARPLPAEPSAAGATEMIDYDMNPAEIRGYAGYDTRVEENYDGDRGEYYAEEYRQPAQVSMPSSRADGIAGRFRRNKREELEETPQQWLDVDENFDARTVGRERGGWESFRDDAQGNSEELTSRRKWEGGSFSRMRLGRVDTRSGENTDADTPTEMVDLEDDRQIADEIEQIYHFRNPQYNTEIWFVALGSEASSHDGTKAFLAEHADELRGSMIIEIESLGLGELSVASAEGRMKRVETSSRFKRFTREATAATGIAPGSVDLTGTDSAASMFQTAGFQAMHLFGVENGQPALKGSPDDILENIDDLLFDDNVNYLMELLKH